jgi:hypothetical protein
MLSPMSGIARSSGAEPYVWPSRISTASATTSAPRIAAIVAPYRR